MASIENGERLIDAVRLVFFQVFGPTLFDQFDDPAGIQIDAKTNPAAILAEMFDCQS